MSNILPKSSHARKKLPPPDVSGTASAVAVEFNAGVTGQTTVNRSEVNLKEFV